ncbi:MAG: DUF6498-containing protein, partial [Candidatus Limnocylindrales bacterium]
MDRLVAWYRLSSSIGAVVALIVANAIPLVGVLFFGWSVWNILIVYWLENGIVGVFNVLKMARAEGPGGGDGVTLNGRSATDSGKLALIPFFIVHYGIFWFVHGVFVLTLPAFTGTFGGGFGLDGEGGGPAIGFPFEDRVPDVGVDPGVIVVAVVALAISHGLSYWWNFLRGGEYRRVSAARQMFAPYGRLVALHLTIILGAVAVIATGAPAAAVAILVALKTVLDVGF